MSYPIPVPMPTAAQGPKTKTEYQREQDIYAAQLAQLKRERRTRLWRLVRLWCASLKTKAAPKDRFDIEKKPEGLSLHKAKL